MLDVQWYALNAETSAFKVSGVEMKTEQITLRLPIDLVETLREAARVEYRSLANEVTMWLLASERCPEWLRLENKDAK